MYSIFMAVSSFILAYYLLAIGYGWHTPRTKKPLGENELQKIRRLAKIAAPALMVLGVLYAYVALSDSSL